MRFVKKLYKINDIRVVNKFLLFPMSYSSESQKETRWLVNAFVLQQYTSDWLSEKKSWKNLGFINLDKEQITSLNLMLESKDDKDKLTAIGIIKEQINSKRKI